MKFDTHTITSRELSLMQVASPKFLKSNLNFLPYDLYKGMILNGHLSDDELVTSTYLEYINMLNEKYSATVIPDFGKVDDIENRFLIEYKIEDFDLDLNYIGEKVSSPQPIKKLINKINKNNISSGTVFADASSYDFRVLLEKIQVSG